MGILKKIQDTVATVKEERKQRRKEIEQQREMLERKERHRIATERALESLRPLNEKLLNLDYKKATPEDVLGLLGRGADVDALERRRAGNWSEITPVALALKAFNYPVFEALVHHGANLSILMVDYEYDDGPGSIFTILLKGKLPTPFLNFTEAGPYYPMPKGGKILSWPMSNVAAPSDN